MTPTTTEHNEWNGITDAHLTADMVLTSMHNGEPHVLLIKRGHEPFAGCWALPGGYVDKGETFEQAAGRELREETGLDAPDRLWRVGFYDAPERDPRARVISVAFSAHVGRMPEPTAGDDAREARWTPVSELPHLELAFDHAQILGDALRALGHPLAMKGAVTDARSEQKVGH